MKKNREGYRRSKKIVDLEYDEKINCRECDREIERFWMKREFEGKADGLCAICFKEDK